MANNLIEIQGISKAFGDNTVLENIHLSVKRGEFLTLLGPSGCGKTTLLRLISGFEQPDTGTISLNGDNLAGLPPNQRQVNTVFQSYALFPHFSVFDNVAFGLRCQQVKEAEIKQRVLETLDSVHLKAFSHRYPAQLSGGQQQRVAIARAVINKPKVLLLDEPLSSLDHHLRKNMQRQLKELQRDLNMTFICVTHDQEEALSLSDRIAIMQDGKIQQIGTPREVYEEPCNVSVAEFTGETNLFDAKIITANNTSLVVEVEGKQLTLENHRHIKPRQKIQILVRPEDLKVLDKTEVKDVSKMFPGVVDEIIYKGSTVDLVVHLNSGKQLFATEFFDEDDEDLDYHLGEQVWVEWIPGWEVILPHET